MKPERLIHIISLILACCIWQVAFISLLLASPAEKTGRVVGVVFDVNNARVKGATVTIKYGTFERKVVSGETGEFEAKLSVGEYYFTVEANGFCRFEGEMLRVRPKTTEVINIHLEVLATHTECRCSSKRK